MQFLRLRGLDKCPGKKGGAPGSLIFQGRKDRGLRWIQRPSGARQLERRKKKRVDFCINLVNDRASISPCNVDSTTWWFIGRDIFSVKDDWGSCERFASGSNLELFQQVVKLTLTNLERRLNHLRNYFKMLKHEAFENTTNDFLTREIHFPTRRATNQFMQYSWQFFAQFITLCASSFVRKNK